MDPLIKSPAEILGQELDAALRGAPFFVSNPLRKFEAALNVWIGSVEARLRALDKMPSAESLRTLLDPAVAAARTPRCICHGDYESQFCPVHRKKQCGDCSDV
jgi:hypothetical protein